MQSRVKGNNYLILPSEDDEYPYKINKKKLDRSLNKIGKSLEAIVEEMKNLYRSADSDADYQLYRFISDEIFGVNRIDFEDGKNWKLSEALFDTRDIQECLATQNDEFPEHPVYEETLEGLGYNYKHGFFCRDDRVFEKLIEKAPDGSKEVVEELWLEGTETGGPLRRLRTITYDVYPGGRSSNCIRYKKLPIGKRLMKAILHALNKKEK